MLLRHNLLILLLAISVALVQGGMHSLALINAVRNRNIEDVIHFSKNKDLLERRGEVRFRGKYLL